MVNEARQAWRGGERPLAVRLLKQALRDDPHNHEAWLLAAEFAPTPQARQECLARAAKFAPAPVATPPTPAPIPTPTADSLLALRHKSQQQTAAVAAEPPPPAPSQRPRHWVWAGLGVIALMVMLWAGWLAWGVLPDPDLAVAAVPSPTPSLIAPTAEAFATAEPLATATAVPPTFTPSPTANPIQPKQIANLSLGGGSGSAEQAQARATWTSTPTPTPTPTPSPTPQPTYVSAGSDFVWPLVGANEKWIQVNLTTQQLNAYEGKTVVFSTPISSGLPQWATVTGQFRIYYRLPSQTMDGRRLGFDYVTENVPFVQYFYQDFALHGAFWHNNFGEPMSHGCVNLSVADSEWLYNWATYGTLVYVHY